MLVFQSIIVYGLMVWVMTYFGQVAYRTQYPQGFEGIDKFQKSRLSFCSLLTRSYFLIPILVFCLISAIRYEVGTDFWGYKNYFYQINTWGRILEEDAVEPAFTFIGKFTVAFTNKHYLMFFILAFLQISFIYYALRKKTYALVYIGMAIMLNFTYHSLMNGVRQNIVACAFVAMLPLILEMKKWPWFIICVLAATLMHKSAMILLPIGLIVYFLLQRNILSIPLQLVVVAICFVFMDKIDIGYLEFFFQLGAEAGYSAEKADSYANLELTGKSFGLWAFVSNLTYVLIMLYSKKIQSWLKNDKIFIVMYNLFFISVCLGLLFYNNFGIGRLNLYLKIFQPIIMSIMLFYTSKYRTKLNVYIYWGILLALSLKLVLLFFMMAPVSNEAILYKFDLFR